MASSPKYIHEICTAQYKSTEKLKIPIQLNQYRIDKIIIEYDYKCVVVSSTDPGTHEKVAIKCVPKEIASEDRNEAELMKQLSHPNVIKYIDDFFYPSTDPRFFAIVMPRAISDLLDYLNTSGPFRENLICQIMKQALNAINYIHANQIWHRDVKLDNFLIMAEARRGVKVALIDFGLSDTFDCQTYCGKCTGTIEYAAPELVCIKEVKRRKRLRFKESGEYSNKVDSWGLGVVLYALVSGILPFDPGIPEDIENLFLGNPEMELPPGYNSDEDDNNPLMKFQDVSEECKDLIRQLLCANPDERITCEEAIQHPWFTLYGDDDAAIFGENKKEFDALEEEDIVE